MNSRTAILDRVRATRLPECLLPSLEQAWVHYDDPVQQFADVLRSVGVSFSSEQNMAQVAAWLQQTEVFQNSQRICSLVPELSLGNVELASIPDPHALADLDLVIAAGEMAVAENGAVWVSDRDIPHRAALFIAQHAVLIVPRSGVVHHLHQAYERIAFQQPGFGVFISGPSKTADIEQSLVIGAHGPKSLHVVLVY